MSGAPELNRLSCARCRDRKIKCNRVMPECGRCKASSVQCAYPARQKRRLNKVEDRSVVTTPTEALNGILDRLRRLENSSSTAINANDSTIITGTSAITPALSTPASPAILIPSPDISLADHDSSVCLSGSVATCITTPFSQCHRRGFNVNEVMLDATNRVQKMRQQSLGASVIAQSIEIPKDLAKRCVASYFARRPEYSWSHVVDRELMELLPDILGLPHVHVDPVMVVIYYSILYNELAIHTCVSMSNREDTYLNQCYLGCLRALQTWQREASGSLADFVAALLVTRATAEYFDFDMSWKMFKLACEYCQALNLHNLDQFSPDLEVDGLNDDMLDQRRKDIWEIIQIDLFFRLTHNMPPAITSTPWKVNLPWLAVDPSLLPDVTESMVFLASSRFTLVVARFFVILEEARDGGDRMGFRAAVEGLCQEILGIYEEYPVTKWLWDAREDPKVFWTIAEACLMGYTSIMHMTRRAELLDNPHAPTDLPGSSSSPEIPYSPVVVDAARNIIDCLNKIFAVFPRIETMMAVFGAYQSHIAFSVLAINILNAPYPLEYADDVELLKGLAERASALCRGQRDITPLTFAMQMVIAEVRAKLEECAVE